MSLVLGFIVIKTDSLMDAQKEIRKISASFYYTSYF